MINLAWEDFWWNNITGANMVVAKVVNALHANKIVILNVPSDLPWRTQMRSAIEVLFQEGNATEKPLVKTVDAQDECSKGIIGKFLLIRFCTSKLIVNGFRERPNISIQKYLIQNNVLKDTLVWVKGINAEQVSDWVKFCQNYKTQSINDGLFLLEIHDFKEYVDTKRMEVINFYDYVSSYDVQLFISFVLDSKKCYTPDWKRYISTVVASLCDVDAEISAELVENVDFKTESPIKGIDKIDKNRTFKFRGSDEKSKHILSYFRKGEIGELNYRIWAAQIQVLFPLIEIKRVKIIEILYDEIADILDKEEIYQYDDVITNPYELELGTLNFLTKNSKVNISNSFFRTMIPFLHNCRNKLAHIECCEPNEVTKLLDDIL